MSHYYSRTLLLLSLLFSLPVFGQKNTLAKTTPTTAETINQALDSTYAKYFNAQDIHKIDAELQRQIVKGQMVLVDTRDQSSCRQVQTQLEQTRNLQPAGTTLSDLCRLDPKYPYASVVILRQSNEEEFRKKINFGMLTSDQKNIFTATRNLGVAGVGVFGLIYMLPESVSKWNRDELKSGLGKKWAKNVKNGPVIDKDDLALNYIGHPISGAAYYQVARHLELTPMQSFGYSVFMSTFFWEYGVEAFAETPSIQDLLVTPIIGSLLGEAFYQLEKSIQKNGGKVWGSESLGKFVMVLLNPAGALSDQINRLFGSKVVKNSRSSIVMKPIENNGKAPPSGNRRSMIAIEIEFFI